MLLMLLKMLQSVHHQPSSLGLPCRIRGTTSDVVKDASELTVLHIYDPTTRTHMWEYILWV